MAAGRRGAVAYTMLAGGLLAAPCATGSFCDDPGFQREWADEFEGESLDSASWSPAVSQTLHQGGARADCAGAGCILLGSCRDAKCLAENVYISEGSLVLRSAANPLSTGAVNTWGKRAWKASDGTFRVCISAKLPGYANDPVASQGIWPAHWLMPYDSSCDPDEGEMDVMEMVDGSGKYAATYHWQDTFPEKNCTYPIGHQEQSVSAPLLGRWNETYHEFSVERSASHVAFALDGQVKLNITRGTTPMPKFWDAPWYLILNTAIGGGWPGPANASTRLPVYHVIDYVRVSRQRAGVR